MRLLCCRLRHRADARGLPRDARKDDDFYELIGDDDGVFGCMSLLACHDVCPKELPLATQIAFLRRKMVSIGWK